MKKTTSKNKHSKKIVTDFRPYRVLFLVVVLSVTSLVLFASLSVGA